MPGELYIGLMSGTSMDGVDAGLLRIGSRFELLAGITRPFARTLKHNLVSIVDNPERVSLDDLGRLDHAIAASFADAALELIATEGLQASDIVAIGSHGQTIRHQPGGKHPFSLQIGNGSIIAARTGIETISDFRSRDVAMGGQGAPLAPAFHQAAFADPAELRVVINIGGIANISILHTDGSVSGHDTGPGNVLMDLWVQQHRQQDYDIDGAMARSGKVHEEWLSKLLEETYFSRPPPKSTGRELFSLPWLVGNLGDWQIAAQDVQATLCELTARSITADVRRFAPGCARCLVCGGGANNDFLMQRLQALLDPVPVQLTGDYAIDPGWVEAAAFAWLAWRTRNHQPGNLPSVTGATGAAVLGSISAGT